MNEIFKTKKNTKLFKIQEKAKRLGIKGHISYSNLRNKKFDLIYKNKVIRFGDSRYQDYWDHKDKKRRDMYRARHSKIYTKNGERAIDVPYSPAYLSYNLLW